MEIKVNEIINWVHSGYRDKLVKVHIIKGNTLDECFRKVYALRRSGRYDSVRRYDFDFSPLERDYQEWKRKNETIEMFYGNATVD